MHIIDQLAEANLDRDTVLTIGAFDGLHLGHQGLLKQLVQRAKETNRTSGLVTFQPHPRVVLSPASETRYLTTLEEKAALVEEIGLDILVVLPFTPALAQTPASHFVSMLHSRLHMRELWIGPDFALGRNREGNAGALGRLGKTIGFDLRVVTPVLQNGQPIRSTHIRSLIAAGQVAEAARWLGRFYSITGQVVRGGGRDRLPSFPTAMLDVPAEKLVPSDGVYAAYARFDGERHEALASIGVRASPYNGERTLEAHLLDFRGDLYGQQLTLQFVERLRSKYCFASAADLLAQIRQDCERARRVLGIAAPVTTTVSEQKCERGVGDV